MPVATQDKVEALRQDLGSQARLAELLGVDRSRVSRWLRGEGLDPLTASRVNALEHVMADLFQVYEPTAAIAWLQGLNPHLGARPIDLIRAGRSVEVLAAVRASIAGSYA